jgi:cytochrome c biogenesis factor
MISLLISILIWLLVFCVVVYVVKLVLDSLPLPPNVRQIVLAILGLIGLLILIDHFIPFVHS